MASGQLKFELRGQKLRGSWALVKMKGRGENAWLLIKHSDAASDREYPIVAQVESVLSGRVLSRDELSRETVEGVRTHGRIG
jgi:bifunctional non-homologous end joining protein LigD